MDNILGEIKMFAFSRNVVGWIPCDGRTLSTNEYGALFTVLGTKFGGDGNNFKVPDLRGRVLIGNGPAYPQFSNGGEEKHALTVQEMPKHRHQAVASTNPSDTATPSEHYWPADAGYVTQANAAMSDKSIMQVGYSEAHENMSPYLTVNYAICVRGVYPGKDFSVIDGLLGAITTFTAVANTKNCLPCDGRLLPVETNLALFSLLKNTYGGDDKTTFALPDLRGRAMVSSGYSNDLTQYRVGEVAGEATVKLTVPQMPKHYHPALASTKGNTPRPDGQGWGNEDKRPATNGFASEVGAGAFMNPAAIGETGGDQSHNNMMPYQAIEYLISVVGFYPSRQ